MSDAVMFVSLGPGDPELITLKGLHALQQADLIYCPSTSRGEGTVFSRALEILISLGIDRRKMELFNVPMSKDRAKAIESYREVAEIIALHSVKGKKVAVAAEGDAGFYSSIHYICDQLNRQGIPYQRIAGVPAFIACGALGNLHLVKQEEELNVIPGIVSQDDLQSRIDAGKRVVLMKPSQCEEVIKKILSEPNDTAFHYFENAGIAEKEFYTTDPNEIAGRKFPYFSLLIIYKQETI